MMHTLLDGKNFCAEFCKNGLLPADDTVRLILNEATQILIQKGNWKNTVRELRMCVSNFIVAMPSDVETVLKVNFDEHPSSVWSMGYEFMDSGPGTLLYGNDTPSSDMVDLGDGWSTFWEIGPTARKIMAFSTEAEDAGKTIRVQGYDDMSMKINQTTAGELITIRQWVGGVEGALNNNIITSALSTNEFQDVTSVIKPETKGYVTMYAYDPVSFNMWILGKYEPYETQPSYRRYRITSTEYDQSEHITALVKLRYAPAILDTDTLLIQHLPALKLMCKSLHQFDHGDPQKGLIYQAKAVQMLDEQLQNSRSATNEFDVDVEGGFGSMPDIM